MKRYSIFIVIISLALMLNSCDSGEKSRLISELYEELESKTEECESLQVQVDEQNHEISQVAHERDTREYERDAFIEENSELKYTVDSLEEWINVLEGRNDENMENYIDKRKEVLSMLGFMESKGIIPAFDEGIKENHKTAITEFFESYRINSITPAEGMEQPGSVFSLISIEQGMGSAEYRASFYIDGLTGEEVSEGFFDMVREGSGFIEEMRLALTEKGSDDIRVFIFGD